MKKILMIPALSLGSVALATIPAFATTSATNDTTGASSNNIAVAKDSCSVSVNQSNYVGVINSIEISSNTGDNQANKNTGDGMVATGDSSVSVSITNSGSSNNADVPSCSSTTVNATNSNTGNKSNNISVAKTKKKTRIRQTNKTFTLSNIWLDLFTGGNKANKNTGDGTVDTGSSTVEVNITNGGSSNSAL